MSKSGRESFRQQVNSGIDQHRNERTQITQTEQRRLSEEKLIREQVPELIAQAVEMLEESSIPKKKIILHGGGHDRPPEIDRGRDVYRNIESAKLLGSGWVLRLKQGHGDYLSLLISDDRRQALFTQGAHTVSQKQRAPSTQNKGLLSKRPKPVRVDIIEKGNSSDLVIWDHDKLGTEAREEVIAVPVTTLGDIVLKKTPMTRTGIRKYGGTPFYSDGSRGMLDMISVEWSDTFGRDSTPYCTPFEPALAQAVGKRIAEEK